MGEIVIGVDGSASSRAALRWAMGVAEARGATTRVVSSWRYPASAGTPAGPTGLPTAEEMDRTTGDDIRAVLVDELGATADQVRVDVRRGSAAGALLTSAGAADVDMLVLGARGLGGFDGLLLGSVTQQCVEHSPCPVVVLRGGEAPQPAGGRIVIGLDSSDGSAKALDWAIDFARDTGSEIVAVNAQSMQTATEVSIGTGRWTDIVEYAERALEEWCEPIRQAGVAHHQRVEAGDPRTALDRVANEVEAALLVVGSRGLGPMRGLLLGSVAGHLVRYATRPIAVVPAKRR